MAASSRSSAAEGEDYTEEILIFADGTVAVKHLTGETLAIALALDPGDERLRERARWGGDDAGSHQED